MFAFRLQSEFEGKNAADKTQQDTAPIIILHTWEIYVHKRQN
jgi:hypothetical protein